MRSLLPLISFASLVGAPVLCILRGSARAQTMPDVAASSATTTPPVLTHANKPVLPEGVVLTEPATVLLELAIDSEGKVLETRVIDGPAALTTGAQAAARQFLFEPARRNGAPVAVRIRYQLVFEPTDQPGASPPGGKAVYPEPPRTLAPATDSAHPTAAVSGTAAQPSTRAKTGLGPAPVQAEPLASEDARASTPAEGELSSSQTTRAVASPPPSALNESPASEDSFGATAEIEAPPREVTRYSIPREELQRVPGTGGDALRAIEVLPGVARTGMDQGDPILRGAAWNESLSLIEGDPVPLLFHFGGVKSAFNSQLLERVDLYPSNFSSRFGRATGGVLEAHVRDPQRDRFHGLVELSVVDSAAVVETPLGNQAAVGLGVRRSNIDFFFKEFVPKDTFRVLAAPVYWDYQGILTYQLAAHHSLRVLVYGSRDSLTLLFSQPSALDSSLRGSVAGAIEYHRAQAAVTSQLGPAVRQRIQATLGTFTGNQDYGPIGSQFTFHELFSRAEWNITAARDLRVDAGLDFQATFLKGTYEGPQAPQNEGNPDYITASTSSFETKRVAGTLDMPRPAAYLELEWQPSAQLLVVPGIRTDYDAFISAWTVNPRLSAHQQVLAETTLKWGAGLYSQSPEYYQSLSGFGNPNLRPYHALHLSAGIEQHLGDTVRLGAEGFYKRLVDRVVMTPGGAPPIYLNDGAGRIYGMELSARAHVGDSSGYLAYTLSRSERQDGAQPWRLFDKDQTHILVLTASHRLGKGWLVGGRFRLISGNPYSPVTGAVFDAGIGTYRPLYGPVNSARNPLFQQLDLRIEKQWTMGPGSLTAYLDLENAYNAQHVEGASYSFDYRRRENVYGIPILPNLGLRGEI